MSLDIVGGAALLGITFVCVFAVTVQVTRSMASRLAVAAGLGAWVGLQASLAGAGFFTRDIVPGLPSVGLMAAVPLVAVALGAAASRDLRGALLRLPLWSLIGLNAGRLLGVFFLLLAAGGRLDGPFPHAAGWGDILVGALALPLAIMTKRGSATTSGILAWNLLGAADLVLAVGLGVLSAEGFAFRLLGEGSGSEAVQSFPWSLIPTVLVPFYLTVHAVILARLLHEPKAAIRAG